MARKHPDVALGEPIVGRVQLAERAATADEGCADRVRDCLKDDVHDVVGLDAVNAVPSSNDGLVLRL